MRRSASASLLGPGYDSVNEDDDLLMEDPPLTSHVSQMNRLTLHDARTPPHSYQRVGSKRRASSPPGEDRLVGNSEPTRKGLSIGPDVYNNSNRRTPPIHHPIIIRSSPGGHSHPKHYHPSLPRSGSGSFTSASASSGATLWSNSIGQFSPAASSLSTQTDWSTGQPYGSNMDTDLPQDGLYRQMPLSSLSRPPSTGRRQLPEISSLGRGGDLPLMQHRVLICECCPKKPKKFDNRDDLQYVPIHLPPNCAHLRAWR